jgi:hypothetical protein
MIYGKLVCFVWEGLLEGGFLDGLAQMDPDRHFEVDGDAQRYEALLHMADLVVHTVVCLNCCRN